MAPKKEKQPLKPIKRSLDSKKPHSVLSEKFMPLYINRDEGASSSSLPSMEDSFPTNPHSHDTNPFSVYLNFFFCDLQERCKTLERKIELVDFLKG